MKNSLIFLFLLLCLLTSCSTREGNPSNQLQIWMEPSGKVKVLSTIAMIDDLVKQVGGEYVDTITLIRGDLDPHSYQIVKGDDEKLAFAQIIFYNGLGLEHGPSLQTYLERNKKAIGLGNLIRSEDPSLILMFKGQVDPHIWMDISLWQKTIPFIVQALSQADPSHAESFQKNGEALSQQMSQVDEEVRRELKGIPSKKRYLVTSHDAFNYFTRAYLADENETKQADWQKRFAAPEGLAPESQLSTSDIQGIIDHLHKYRIHVMFPESNVSKDSIRKIVQAAREKGLDVTIATTFLYADAMGVPGSDGDTYLKMIRHNAKTIAGYLDGQNN